MDSDSKKSREIHIKINKKLQEYHIYTRRYMNSKLIDRRKKIRIKVEFFPLDTDQNETNPQNCNFFESVLMEIRKKFGSLSLFFNLPQPRTPRAPSSS